MKKILCLGGMMLGVVVSAADRPNIVWITTEDNSPHWLRLYNEHGAPMPNVESLAANGLVFTNAYSNAPVCSVARSTLLSGAYATRLGVFNHRADTKVPFPKGLKPYPLYFKEAGYYTANCAKTDYNFSVSKKKIWDTCGWKKDYRSRKPGQPFFQVWSLYRTHEGQIFDLSKPSQANPEKMRLFPYHPDTSTFRKAYAAYHDRHVEDDGNIGRFLSMLKEDGVMDDTIIFYYGDHGGVLPRSKGYVYESGLKVPLVISAGKNWKHLLPKGDGARINGFVNFIDFAATAMNLAGIPIPKEIDGKPFLGKGVSLDELESRNETFGSADRFDEKYDMVRSYRKGRYKYIRNYQPFTIDALYNKYRYKQPAFKEWLELFRSGDLNSVQSQFFKERPAEFLFDLEKDPHEINNLSGDPQYSKVVVEMRNTLTAHVKSLPDLGFYPEPYLVEKASDNPVLFGQKHKEDIAELVDLSNLSLLTFDEAKPRIALSLESKDPMQRYWGMIVCTSFGNEAKEFLSKAGALVEVDSSSLVRIRAAEFLALTSGYDPVPVITDIVKKSKSRTEALLALNTASLLKMHKPHLIFTIDYKSFPQRWIEKGDRSWLAIRSEFLAGR